MKLTRRSFLRGLALAPLAPLALKLGYLTPAAATPIVPMNAAGETYTWVAWAEKPMFEKFGSYVGNGSADGPMVHTGMKPDHVILKSNEDWQIHDTVRDETEIDFLSDGFKIRSK